MLLVEAFAVVRHRAATDLLTPAEPHLQEPIGIGEALARGGHDVAITAGERAFGEREGVDAAGADDRRFPSAFADREAHFAGERKIAAERPALVGIDRGHTLVSTLAR